MFYKLEKHEKTVMWLYIVIIYIVSFIVYNANFRVITSGDNYPTKLLSINIIKYKSLFLDNFYPELTPKANTSSPHYSIRIKNGHVVAEKTTGMAIFVASLFYTICSLISDGNIEENVANADFQSVINKAEKITSSLIASFCVVLIFLLCLNLNFKATLSMIITFIYAFATNHWTTSSQGLWVHGGIEFWLLLSLLLIILYEKTGTMPYFYLGAFSTGMLYFIRITGALYVVCILSYIYVCHKNKFFQFLFIPTVLITFYSSFNILELGSIVGGYTDIKVKHFWEYGLKENFLAFLGMFLSPGRGLLIYTPIILLSFVGIYFSTMKKFDMHKLFIFMIPAVFLIILLHTTYSDTNKWLKWYGGHCYGPRYFVDVLPILIIFISVPLDIILHSKNIKEKIILIITILLLSWSVFTQFVGAFYYKGYWDNIPKNIDENPYRVWDIRNNPIKTELKSGMAIETKSFYCWLLGKVPLKPLSDQNYKAEIVLVGKPICIKKDSVVMFELKVKNLGNETFPSVPDKYGRYIVNLSYHWLKNNGEIYTFDGIRTKLPFNLKPGKDITIKAIVKTPDVAGNYIIEFDLVQEFAAWFKDKGSTTLKIPVVVD